MRWCSRVVVWVRSQGAPETVLPSSHSGPVWGPNRLCPPTMSSANWPKGRTSVKAAWGWACCSGVLGVVRASPVLPTCPCPHVTKEVASLPSTGE